MPSLIVNSSACLDPWDKQRAKLRATLSSARWRSCAFEKPAKRFFPRSKLSRVFSPTKMFLLSCREGLPRYDVLVSAYTARLGFCAELLELILTDPRCSLRTGEVNLSELRSVLRRRPFRVRPALIEEIESQLRDQTIIPKPLHPADLPVRDPADRWVLASAVAGRRICWSLAIKIFSTLPINHRCRSSRRENAGSNY
jgi:hypothetical protein